MIEEKGVRQMHAQVRGCVLPLKARSWASVDQRGGGRKQHSHRLKAFRYLTRVGSGAGSQGLYQGEIGNI